MIKNTTNCIWDLWKNPGPSLTLLVNMFISALFISALFFSISFLSFSLTTKFMAKSSTAKDMMFVKSDGVFFQSSRLKRKKTIFDVFYDIILSPSSSLTLSLHKLQLTLREIHLIYLIWIRLLVKYQQQNKYCRRKKFLSSYNFGLYVKL